MAGSHRAVTPLLDMFRTVFRGRPTNDNNLRFADQLASRTQPQPNLSCGPYNKTSGIYYFTRDARREVNPSTVIIGHILAPGTEKSQLKYLTPGKAYQPDSRE